MLLNVEWCAGKKEQVPLCAVQVAGRLLAFEVLPKIFRQFQHILEDMGSTFDFHGFDLYDDDVVESWV